MEFKEAGEMLFDVCQELQGHKSKRPVGVGTPSHVYVLEQLYEIYHNYFDTNPKTIPTDQSEQ
jgi:hypothetical protein